MKNFLAALAAGLVLLATSTLGWAKPVYTVLHTFTDYYNDGSPVGGLLPVRDGTLYGATQNTVFRLAPPVVGQASWTYQVIARFEGAKGPLIADATGALYGTASPSNGASSWAFKLTPPSSTQSVWQYEIIHLFEFRQYENDVSPLTFDASGQLYGTTRAGGPDDAGTVFRLSPPTAPNTQWTYTLLYSFRGFQNHDGQNPAGPVTVRLVNGAVNLFGATSVGGTIAIAGGGPNGDGTVFRLTAPSPPQSKWGYTVLHNFGAGQDGRYCGGNLIVHDDLTVIGITFEGPRNGGTVYALTPPGPGKTEYTLANLYEFGNRGGDTFTYSLLESLSGTLYGIQYGALGQPVIKLLPSAGTGPRTLNVLHQFQSGSPQGR